MKNRLAVLLLTLPLIASCGGGASSSTSSSAASIVPTEALTRLSAAGQSTYSASNVRFQNTTGKVETHFAVKDEETGEVTNYGIKVSPAVFDLRLGGLSETDPNKVYGSLETKNGNTQSKVYVEGIDLPPEASIFIGKDGGFTTSLAYHFDMEQIIEQPEAPKSEEEPKTYVVGTNYIDFTNAGALRIALNVFLPTVDKSFKKMDKRTKFTMEKQPIEDVTANLPLATKLKSASTKANDRIRELYGTSPSSFSFKKEQGIETVSFATKDWATLKGLLGSYADVASVSKAFDTLSADSTLNRCNVSVSFSPNALTQVTYDIAFSFKDKESTATARPTGNWLFQGTTQVYTGTDAAPKKLTEKEKGMYVEGSLPNLGN